MSLSKVKTGRDVPNDVNVIIEIPARSEPIKYEVDKESGALFVDRFMSTCMYYPCDYGYIPHTLSDDGDPVDALVVSPFPLIHGTVVRCRPIGILKMSDESGFDVKVIVVPVEKLTPLYKNVKTLDDLPKLLLDQIAHFFTHYKDLEAGKWVKLEGWDGPDAARKEILHSIKQFEEAIEKPAF
jgi:inorganic pyrophosphatase